MNPLPPVQLWAHAHCQFEDLCQKIAHCHFQGSHCYKDLSPQPHEASHPFWPLHHFLHALKNSTDIMIDCQGHLALHNKHPKALILLWPWRKDPSKKDQQGIHNWHNKDNEQTVKVYRNTTRNANQTLSLNWRRNYSSGRSFLNLLRNGGQIQASALQWLLRIFWLAFWNLASFQRRSIERNPLMKLCTRFLQSYALIDFFRTLVLARSRKEIGYM